MIKEDYEGSATFRPGWMLLFALVTLLIVGGCYAYGRQSNALARQNAIHGLTAVGEMKAELLQGWRKERLSDAIRSSTAPFFRGEFEDWLTAGEGTALPQLFREQLLLDQVAYGYANALLLAADGSVLVAANAADNAINPETLRALENARETQTPFMADLHFTETGEAFIDTVAHIPGSDGAPLGFVVLRSDASELLFPLVQQWPVPSQTAEVMLVRQEGDSVRILTSSRHSDPSGTPLRLPLTDSQHPIVQALSGTQGITEGLDYRHERVLADLRPLHGTPWFLVAKVDASELLAEARFRTRVAVLIAVLAIVLSGGILAYASRQRQAAIYKARYDAERRARQTLEEFRTTIYSIGEAVITTDSRGRVRHMNPVAELLTGWPESEAGGRPLAEVFRIVDEQSRESIADPVELIRERGGTVVLARHTVLIARDGSERPIADSGAPIHDESGASIGVVLVFRDQSDERAVEQALRESEQRFRGLYENAASGILIHDAETGAVVDANRKAISDYGLESLEELQAHDIWLDPPYSSEDAMRIIRRVVAVGPQQFEWKRQDIHGRVFWEDVTTFTMPMDGATRIIAITHDITARKQVEEALAHASHELERFFEVSLDMLCIADTGTGFLKVNKAWEDALGYPPEMLLGNSYMDLVHPDDFEATVAATERLANQQPVDAFVNRYRAADGAYRHIEWRAASPDGRLIYAAASDITARMQAEEAIQRELSFSRQLIVAMADGFVLLDAAGVTVDVNPAFCAMTGFTREELIGDVPPYVYWPPEELESIQAAYQQTLIGKQEVFDLVFQRKNGERFPVIISPSHLVDAQGRITSYFATITDMSERKQADEERERLLSAIEQSSESILITDTAGAILYVNPAFERITGFSRQEALGENPRILNSGEQSPELYRELWSTILAGETWHGRLRNRRKDGTLFTEDATISPVRDRSGAVTNFVAVKRDIGREEELEMQLRQAQKMDAVGRLAGGIAHDFNNMLGVILGHAELALEITEPSDPIHEDLVQIQAAGRRSADLTRQLLSFARKQTIAPKLLALNDTIASMLKMLQRLIGEDIVLAWEPGKALLAVRMDPTQIDQVLVNLVVNARDAIVDGGRITIATHNVEVAVGSSETHAGFDPGRYVLLTLSDTGSGMDEATVEHLFEPFFSTKELGRGTGLGLATVYGIVKQNNGYIDVQSRPGEGTVFRIYLPAFEDVLEMDEGGRGLTPVPVGTETILLVEDEGALLTVNKRFLERQGYTVLPAADPHEAIQVAVAHGESIDLLITDVVMPDMNGREVRDVIIERNPSMKCLFVSGYTADIIANHGVVGENVHFLQKPFSMQVLAAKVREVLGKSTTNGRQWSL